MYLYFDENGTLKEIISEPIRQGSSNFNKIYVYWENKPSVISYWVTFKKPDKTFTNEMEVNTLVSKAVPYSAKRDLKFFKDYQNYSFLEINVPDEVLSQNGLVLSSVRAVLNDNATQTLGMITFNVEESAIQFDNYITESQYNYLVELVGEKATWTDIENYIGVSRTNVVPYINFVGYLKDVVFKQNTDDIQTLFTLYNSILGNNYEVVNSLPVQGLVNTLYWLNIGDNLYDIYIYQNGEYQKLFDNVSFNPDDFATRTEFDALVKETPTDISYIEESGLTLMHDGAEISGQEEKVKLPQINSKRLVGDYDIEVFEAGGEVENVEETNHRTTKEAMLEPYTIDIADKTTLNYAEYNILIRQTQNYLIYNKNLLKLSSEDDNYYYYYCNNKFCAKVSKTANDDNEHTLEISENTLVKFFINGTNTYISSTIVALSHKSNGDVDIVKQGDYPANGIYNETKQVYKINYNYTEQDRYVITLYFTDGTNITLNASLILTLKIIFTMEDF